MTDTERRAKLREWCEGKGREGYPTIPGLRADLLSVLDVASANARELAAAKRILLHAFDDTHDGSPVSKKTVLEVLAHVKEHGFR